MRGTETAEIEGWWPPSKWLKMLSSIKEVKALCACTIREAEACQVALMSKVEIQHTTCIKEAEANCTHASAEAENCCSTPIREAESWGASQACSIQQSHTEDIQHLEAEAIEEEKRECLAFLAASGTALRASSPEALESWLHPSTCY